jgi:hypothetical protein
MLRNIGMLVVVFALNASAVQQPRAHALALCSTEDGQYTVLVVETKNTIASLKRIFLAIKDERGNFVASFYGKTAPGESKKYGSVKYVDSATDGSQFLLDAPSEGRPGFQISATLTVSGKNVTLHGGNMQCSAYNRQLPGR